MRSKRFRRSRMKNMLYQQDEIYEEKWIPRGALAIYIPLLFFGTAGIAWNLLVSSAMGNPDAEGSAAVLSMLGEASFFFGNIWIDVACALIGAAGMLICPMTRDVRQAKRERARAERQSEDWAEGWRSTGRIRKAANDVVVRQRKEELFSIYCDIYDMFDRVFYLESEKCKRDKWDRMSYQLGRMYNLLSFHRGKREFPSSIDIDFAIVQDPRNDTLLDIEKDNLLAIKEEVDKLTRLWASSVGLGGTRIFLPAMSRMTDPYDDTRKLGEKLGIDVRVEAHYDHGVPLEDLMF